MACHKSKLNNPIKGHKSRKTHYFKTEKSRPIFRWFMGGGVIELKPPSRINPPPQYSRSWTKIFSAFFEDFKTTQRILSVKSHSFPKGYDQCHLNVPVSPHRSKIWEKNRRTFLTFWMWRFKIHNQWLHWSTYGRDTGTLVNRIFIYPPEFLDILCSF